MRLSQCAFGVALVSLLLSAPLRAANNVVPEPASADSSSYYAAGDQPSPSPSDQPSPSPSDQASPSPSDQPAPATPAPEAPAEAANPCGTPWTLQSCLSPCRPADSQFTYGGWVEAGVSGNDHGVLSGTGNLPISFNSVTDAPMVNQVWGWAQREAKTNGCGWDWGFRLDYLFGTDGPDTQAFGDIGYDNDWDSGRDYGSALPQLYAQLAYNDVSLKLGHFFTPIGYEVVPATGGNFFYSHSYTMLYAEPFTHTGALADYTYDEQLKITAGWTQGWDSGFNNVNDANTFLGGFTWTSCDKNSQLIYMASAGDWGKGVVVPDRNTVLNQGDIYMQSIVFTHKFSHGVTYAFQSDLGVNTNLPTPSTCWYGVNQYLTKDINCCWSVGARFEWFRDEDGVRVVGNNPGNYWEMTLGANWKPQANINVRPEVRYDWFDGTGLPYADGTRSDEVTWGVDAWFTF